MKKINFSTYFQKRKQRISISGVSPRFDWLLILGISALALVVGVIYAFFVYVRVNSGALFVAEEKDFTEIELENKKEKIREKVKIIEEQNKVKEEIFDERVVN